MSLQNSLPPSPATVSRRGGYGAGYFLPPLSVLVTGGLMAVFMLGQANATVNAREAFLAERILEGTTQDEDLLSMPSNLSPVFTDEVDYWSEPIQRWAGEAELDPNMVATVMQIESCGDPQALSGAGAMGLFQVMPFHFADGENPYDPDTNAARGMGYLSRSLESASGDPRLAFAGYNGGIGVIGRPESSWADETLRYAYWGSGIYAEARDGAQESLRLQEWLQAGGASLCRQAAERLGIDP